jgi:hypothetical protein
MELLTPEERRTRKSYRWVFVGGVALVVAMVWWLARPPSTIDLRFLGTLKPQVDAQDGSSYATLTFSRPSAEVVKLLDSHLNEASHWRKDAPLASMGHVTYGQPGWQGATISVQQNGPKATLLWISDPRNTVLLPK